MIENKLNTTDKIQKIWSPKLYHSMTSKWTLWMQELYRIKETGLKAEGQNRVKGRINIIRISVWFYYFSQEKQKETSLKYND